MTTIDKIVGTIVMIGSLITSGCAGKYATVGASAIIPTKYDTKTYASAEASSGGQIKVKRNYLRVGAGVGHSEQENQGLNVKTLRYFAEMMYLTRKGFYVGIRHNTYNDEISGIVEDIQTINEIDGVVGFEKGQGYVEGSVSETTLRISAGTKSSF